ncbi:von Willebrand factor type A domain protein [Stieleria maiorica]|uniref:von Willebrand factor type A domain protein n=1 Tax=Stieleria maiorica TaxID=2795974 RepID=A0A5B9MAN9_9BACT|nr:VWA domain-containing protein [Stieleria maiorica]QEF98208.1 von Willebrand factor type A domain protein [Stieleria maiorica]
MGEIEFRDPAFLLLAILAPLVYWLARRTPSRIRYSSIAIVQGAPRSWRARLATAPAWLMALAVLSISVALAAPRTPDAESKVSREGIAIMMVLDRSGSMQARDLVQDDYSVDRLSVVKDVFRSFVLGEGDTAGEGRPDDTIGLVAFAGFADSLCPLTLDHGNLTTMVNDLEIVSPRAEDGTAIGDGLALAVERLRRSDAKSKVAILLTDGVHNRGVIDPKQAAEVAAASDVKVYCIGAGTQGRAPIPVADPFTGRTELRLFDVELDEDTLKMIAETTGGRYFRATDRESLSQVYADIDALERTKVTEYRYLQYDEHYRPFLLAGLLLVGLAATSKASLFRTLP